VTPTGDKVTRIFQPIDGVVCKPCERHHDSRGWLVELFRSDELPQENWPQMAYVSETLPGVARGPHEHVHQSDFFAFLGPADFLLYLWDSRPDSPTQGNRVVVVVGQSTPRILVVPPGVVHAYQNVSSIPGLVFNAPNRLYGGLGRREPIDEIRHEDQEGSPYELGR
jgi:dTDP-4-dehydrorhamnose 3,5-epimerase